MGLLALLILFPCHPLQETNSFLCPPRPPNTWIYFEIQKAASDGIYAVATEKDVIKGPISLKKITVKYIQVMD